MKDIACLCVAVAAVSVTNVGVAVDTFFVETRSLPAGANDQRIELRYHNDVPILAYSFGIRYDNSVLSLNGASTDGTAAEAAFGPGPLEDGDVLPLKVEGALTDGTPIEGEDVVVILKKGRN